jgi:hypothetical protein
MDPFRSQNVLGIAGQRLERGMAKRPRVKHTISFLERLANHSNKVRAKAVSLPEGQERDAMFEKLKRTETAARISQWLSSGEEDPPEELHFLK